MGDGMGDGMSDRGWTVHGSTYPLADRWIRVRADDCTTESGVPVTPYYVLEYPDFVHVLAEDEAGRIVLVRQYRHGSASPSLELPGGVMDPEDADILAAASRELREETGYLGGRLEPVVSLSVDPARYTNRTHLVRAVGVRPGPAAPEADEAIEVVRVSRAEATRLALSGAILNAGHAGLLLIGLSRG